MMEAIKSMPYTGIFKKIVSISALKYKICVDIRIDRKERKEKKIKKNIEAESQLDMVSKIILNINK